MCSYKENKSAILIFANSSLEELRHKAIANGVGIFDALTSQTIATAVKTGLPYFLISEKEQFGNTFGERFTNAIQSIFDKGFEQVITIGNDSPQLKASHILEAKTQLESKKFVLGPSTDGGFYLMGIHKSQFNSADFRKLSWQTSSLSKQLLRLITASSVTVFRLPALFDIDTVDDIKSLVSYAYRLPEKLLLLLLNLLPSEEKIRSQETLLIPRLHKNILQNKGSPLVLPL